MSTVQICNACYLKANCRNILRKREGNDAFVFGK